MNQQLISQNNSLKEIALYCICIYIIGSGIFESANNTLSAIASYTLYASLVIGFIYLLSIKRIVITKGFVLILVWAVLIAVSSIYSLTSSSDKSMYILRLLKTLPLLLILGNAVTRERDIHLLLYAFIIAGAGMAIYMYITYGFNNLITGGNRIDNLLGNQNTVGLRCAFGIVFAVYELFVNTLSKKKRFFTFILIIISVPAMLFSGSRKSLLIVAVAILVLIFTKSDNKIGYIRNLFVILLIGSLMYLLLNYIPEMSFFAERMGSLLNVFNGSSDASLSDANRIYFIQEGFKRFLESPIFGKGFLASYVYFGTYSHCNYIELLLDLGIVGFTYYYSWFYMLLCKKNSKTYNKRLRTLIVVLCMACLVEDIGVVSFYDRTQLLMFMLMFTIIDRKLIAEDVN